MDSRKLQPDDLAKLMRKAENVAAYFRRLAGRCHQRNMFTTDPLRIAADDMEQAAYRAAVRALGDAAGIDNPWLSDGKLQTRESR